MLRALRGHLNNATCRAGQPPASLQMWASYPTNYPTNYLRLGEASRGEKARVEAAP
jgi:hypothetical protein